MSKLVFLHDRFLSEDKAAISFLDLSIQRGYAIFDFFRLIGNHPLHLEDHLNRFYSSAEQMRLTVPKSREDIKHIIKELIWENELPDSGFRIQLTGGNFDDGQQSLNPVLFISQLVIPNLTEDQIEKGIRLITYEHQRQLPQVKTTDYLMSIWLQPLLKEQSADDILYHQKGIVTESPRSNFFIVTNDGKLVTPVGGILKGITRMKVLMLASGAYPIEERDLTIEEILSSPEAFITSTTKQILPVTELNGKKIGDGKPGAITKDLINKLREHIAR